MENSLYTKKSQVVNPMSITFSIHKKVMAHDWVMQLHGFYLDIENKDIRFDVVMSFDINPKEGLRIIYDEVSKAYPEYNFQIAPDVDISD